MQPLGKRVGDTMRPLVLVCGVLFSFGTAQIPQGCLGLILADVIPAKGGAVVGEVRFGPGQSAGILAGDVILKIGVWPIPDRGEVFRALRGYRIGEQTTITFARFDSTGKLVEQRVPIVIGQRLYDNSCSPVPATR